MRRGTRLQQVITGAVLFVLFFMLMSDPLAAESSCADCIKAAQDGYMTCINEAISVDDKIGCEEKRDAQMKTCESGECAAERQDLETKPEVRQETR